MTSQVTVSDAVARPIRTAGQLVPAVVLTDVVDSFIYDLSDKQYGVAVAFLTLLVGWGQTVFENYKGKGFLREVPSPQVPVVDDYDGKHEA